MLEKLELKRVLIEHGESRVVYCIAVALLVVFTRGESSKVKRTVKRIGIAEQVSIGWCGMCKRVHGVPLVVS